MKARIFQSTLAILTVGLVSLLFLTGASNQNERTRYTVAPISADRYGLYIIDQFNGNIYFLDDDPRVTSTSARIRRVGRIPDAR